MLIYNNSYAINYFCHKDIIFSWTAQHYIDRLFDSYTRLRKDAKEGEKCL
jgi:hypothetical protein